MQDQRGNLDETHVPGPRHPSDDDVAVGTAHTDHETSDAHDTDARDDERQGETYPAGTYASGSALTDTDHDGIADRDDVEVVDHDQALEEERADERSDDARAYGGSDDRTGDRVDDERSDATRVDGGSAGWTGDRSDGQADGGSDDRTGDRGDDWAGGGMDTGDTARDETAEEIAARDEDEARGDADFVPADIESRADERDEEQAAAAEDAEDRAWAAEHATQLRAGSLPEDQPDTHTADHTADHSADRTAVLADDRTDDDASTDARFDNDASAADASTD
ncbi:hypothetical protein, partial [Dactylosporangium sp. NPDC000521]|uniref:hypothetical protein n=1 Tax=Dactylosporangium sp. NPDC000521 TaxID=3363975 RepID=UPI00368E035D